MQWLNSADVAGIMKISIKKARQRMREMNHFERPLRVDQEALAEWAKANEQPAEIKKRPIKGRKIGMLEYRKGA